MQPVDKALLENSAHVSKELTEVMVIVKCGRQDVVSKVRSMVDRNAALKAEIAALTEKQVAV